MMKSQNVGDAIILETILIVAHVVAASIVGMGISEKHY
jgi:hypothetical protein